ncbi:MAG: DUF4492 domain-containing protein [Paludibacter sp.]|nr:DUF4492 domain-containing protein [Paludibacter sp.]
MKKSNIFNKLYIFYRDGFSNMTVGKTLWLIVIIKLFIMFAILKVFFFPNLLNSTYDTKEEKSEHVRHELINKAK